MFLGEYILRRSWIFIVIPEFFNYFFFFVFDDNLLRRTGHWFVSFNFSSFFSSSGRKFELSSIVVFKYFFPIPPQGGKLFHQNVFLFKGYYIVFPFYCRSMSFYGNILLLYPYHSPSIQQLSDVLWYDLLPSSTLIIYFLTLLYIISFGQLL